MAEVRISQQRASGKGRQYWRIREFLDNLVWKDASGTTHNGMSMAQLGRSIGISSQQVQVTVRGYRNNARVLQQLEKLGCPPQYLYGDIEEARIVVNL